VAVNTVAVNPSKTPDKWAAPGAAAAEPLARTGMMAAPARAGAWKSRTAAARMAAGMAATTSATEAERDSAAAVGDMQEEDAVATLVGAGCAGAAPHTVLSRGCLAGHVQR